MSDSEGEGGDSQLIRNTENFFMLCLVCSQLGAGHANMASQLGSNVVPLWGIRCCTKVSFKNKFSFCYFYEAYSESKYRFTVKKNQVRFLIKFYCYQILHSSNYFSTYSPPLLRHLQ